MKNVILSSVSFIIDLELKVTSGKCLLFFFFFLLAQLIFMLCFFRDRNRGFLKKLGPKMESQRLVSWLIFLFSLKHSLWCVLLKENISESWRAVVGGLWVRCWRRVSTCRQIISVIFALWWRLAGTSPFSIPPSPFFPHGNKAAWCVWWEIVDG